MKPDLFVSIGRLTEQMRDEGLPPKKVTIEGNYVLIKVPLDDARQAGRRDDDG